MTQSYQQDLLALLPDDVPRPTETHLATLAEIDDSVNGSLGDIFDKSIQVRHEIKAKLHPRTFKKIIFQSVSHPGHALKSDPRYPTDISSAIMVEHQRRIAQIRTLVSDNLFFTDNACSLEDGGTKSKQRLVEKINQKISTERPHPTIMDISRIRVVVPKLPLMHRAIITLAEGLYRYNDKMRIVDIIDWLYGLNLTKYQTPLRCANVIFQPYQPHGDQRLLTEMQFVTRRMRAGMDLNHPFDVTKRLAYPSPEHKNWMHTVIMKAGLLDYQSQLEALSGI